MHYHETSKQKYKISVFQNPDNIIYIHKYTKPSSTKYGRFEFIMNNECPPSCYSLLGVNTTVKKTIRNKQKIIILLSISVLGYLSLGLSASWMSNERNKYLRNISISDR